ncbi:phosphoglycolate phosphatase, bacterial [Collimonas arenae]|uniref:Phosphoglycolate phosphatase n=1 Tax=Collimonas arenae TaxID=279058 RepID=A0A127QEI0_9BURK|nr:phosphoglycolate phosphatase, bacterial [Collimonas arenae]AMP08467.1 phosphoglycolate phosphatase, bacterial [Collimonas arenae]
MSTAAASEVIALSGIAAAIIDLDGTMLDTAPDFQVAVNRMRDEMDLAPLEQKTIVDFVGKGSENLIRRVLAVDFPAQQVEQHFDAALNSYQRHYEVVNGTHASLYPGVVEGLQAMRDKGLRLACVTNKPLVFALALLEKAGLRDYFELVYGGDSFPRKKPDPMPLLAVCADFELEPAQVVAIGDSSNDAQAARAAGCRVFNVPYGYNHGESIQDVDSDGIVASLLVAAHHIST